MTGPPGTMPDEAWDVAFDAYDPGDEMRLESLLALGNGVLLVRAAAACTAADGHCYPGTRCAGFYDLRDEGVDGQNIVHDEIANLPDWLPLLFRADAMPPASPHERAWREALEGFAPLSGGRLQAAAQRRACGPGNVGRAGRRAAGTRGDEPGRG